jgi:outer membrane lipoprotein-sorting protein
MAGDKVRRMSARARWAVPAGAAAAVGIVIGATAVASASEPSLPGQSVAQLLADVQQGTSRPLGPLTATVQETANLGLPALPQISCISGQSGRLGALGPLAGTTSVSVWYLDQQHIRVAEAVQMGESDLRLDGKQLWLWDSKTQTATHVLLPQQVGNARPPLKTPGASASFKAGASSESPLAAARQALAAVGPSTTVRLGPDVSVAGRAAYQISIAPKASGSLVSQILIAIDASRHIPLQVQVFARGSSSPAFQIGFTALTFGRPAVSNFAFTPPPGAKVKNVTVPANGPAGFGNLGPRGLGLGGLGLGGLGLGGLPGSPAISVGPPCSVQLSQTCSYARPLSPRAAALRMAAAKQMRAQFAAHLPKNLTSAQRAAAIRVFDAQIAARQQGKGIGWIGIAGPAALPKAALQQLRAQFLAHLPKNLTAAQRARAIAAFDRKLAAAMTANPGNGGGFFAAPNAAGSPTVLGKDWTSVIVTPASPAVAAAVQQMLSGKLGPTSSGVPQSGAFGSSQQAAPGSVSSSVMIAQAPGNGPPTGPYVAVAQALLKATTPVHGAWGSGRLLRTALLSVLITSKGQILAGAVTPSVLYADAAALSR